MMQRRIWVEHKSETERDDIRGSVFRIVLIFGCDYFFGKFKFKIKHLNFLQTSFK